MKPGVFVKNISVLKTPMTSALSLTSKHNHIISRLDLLYIVGACVKISSLACLRWKEKEVNKKQCLVGLIFKVLLTGKGWAPASQTGCEARGWGRVLEGPCYTMCKLFICWVLRRWRNSGSAGVAGTLKWPFNS